MSRLQPNAGGSDVDRRAFLGAAGAAVTGMIAGCLGSDPDETIVVGANGEASFEPQTLEVPTDSIVEFVWEGDDHTLLWDNVPSRASQFGDWEGVTEPQDEGHSVSREIEWQGTYDFYCDQHDDMTGTIEAYWAD